MKVFVFTMCFLLRIISIGADSSKHYLSICAMFQDEAPYLKEWIEFHRLVGVKHFYLYSNNSDDNYKEVLEPYIHKGIVDLTEWNRPNKWDYWLEDQKSAYMHCVQRSIGKTTWLAFIDIDEFIVPVIDLDLNVTLSRYDQCPQIGGIKVNWQLYGTSNVESIPKDKLLIETLVWKAPTNYLSQDTPHNHVIKSIVRPEAVILCRAHECDLSRNYFYVPIDAEGRLQPVQVDLLRVNHYWTRDRDYFYNVKIGRRLRYREDEFRRTMLNKERELNQVKDPIMMRFVPRIRKRMGLETS